MLKLKKLQQQQQQKSDVKEEEKVEGEGDAGAKPAPTGGMILKKQNSKELLEKRQTRAKENLLSLRRGGRSKKKTTCGELRATKDVTEMEEIPGVVTDFPDTNNLMHFNATITPSDGLYRGAAFKFTVVIPTSYPYDPPKVECATLVYHPNIDWEGHVCLNILRADWMPVLNLGSVLFGLMTLFLEPNPDDPLNKEAAQLMIEKPSEFQRNVDQSLRGGYVLGRQFPSLRK